MYPTEAFCLSVLTYFSLRVVALLFRVLLMYRWLFLLRGAPQPLAPPALSPTLALPLTYYHPPPFPSLTQCPIPIALFVRRIGTCSVSSKARFAAAHAPGCC